MAQVTRTKGLVPQTLQHLEGVRGRVAGSLQSLREAHEGPGLLLQMHARPPQQLILHPTAEEALRRIAAAVLHGPGGHLRVRGQGAEEGAGVVLGQLRHLCQAVREAPGHRARRGAGGGRGGVGLDSVQEHPRQHHGGGEVLPDAKEHVSPAVDAEDLVDALAEVRDPGGARLLPGRVEEREPVGAGIRRAVPVPVDEVQAQAPEALGHLQPHVQVLAPGVGGMNLSVLVPGSIGPVAPLRVLRGAGLLGAHDADPVAGADIRWVPRPRGVAQLALPRDADGLIGVGPGHVVMVALDGFDLPAHHVPRRRHGAQNPAVRAVVAHPVAARLSVLAQVHHIAVRVGRGGERQRRRRGGGQLQRALGAEEDVVPPALLPLGQERDRGGPRIGGSDQRQRPPAPVAHRMPPPEAREVALLAGHRPPLRVGQLHRHPVAAPGVGEQQVPLARLQSCDGLPRHRHDAGGRLGEARLQQSASLGDNAGVVAEAQLREIVPVGHAVRKLLPTPAAESRGAAQVLRGTCRQQPTGALIGALQHGLLLEPSCGEEVRLGGRVDDQRRDIVAPGRGVIEAVQAEAQPGVSLGRDGRRQGGSGKDEEPVRGVVACQGEAQSGGQNAYRRLGWVLHGDDDVRPLRARRSLCGQGDRGPRFAHGPFPSRQGLCGRPGVPGARFHLLRRLPGHGLPADAVEAEGQSGMASGGRLGAGEAHGAGIQEAGVDLGIVDGDANAVGRLRVRGHRDHGAALAN